MPRFLLNGFGNVADSNQAEYPHALSGFIFCWFGYSLQDHLKALSTGKTEGIMCIVDYEA